MSPANGGMTTVATGIADSIKTLPPTLLLIVLLNMVFAAGAAYYLTGIENKRSEAMKLILDRCVPRAAPSKPTADD